MKKPTGPKPNLKETLDIIGREMDNGNLKRAETIAAHLRAHYPRRPEVNDKLGSILARLAQHTAAHQFHRMASDSDPYNVDYLMNVAHDLMQMGRVFEAEQTYRRVLEINPRDYLAELALARFYDDAGLGERALDHYETALARADEARKPGINFERMHCLVSLGRVDECKKEFEEGFEAGAYHNDFVSLYASLDRWNVNSEAYALVLNELELPKLSRQMRCALLTRKARIEENSGLYDQSYETLLMAKRQTGITYDPAPFRRRTDERIRYVTHEFLAQCAQRVGHPSARSVFVVGMPRSGTTLTEQIIAGHSMAGGVGELETMSYLVGQLIGDRPYSEIQRSVDHFGPDGIRQLGNQYEQVTTFLAPGKSIIVDKMPHNFIRMGEISLILPKARFVHCIRNAADNFISTFQNDMSPAHAYSYDRDTFGDYYDNYLRLMRHWYDAIPGRIFTLQYEELVTDPARVIRSLLDFLDLPFEEACLHPQDRGSQIRTFSKLQARNPINANSVGRWRNYQHQLESLARRFEGIQPFPAIS